MSEPQRDSIAPPFRNHQSYSTTTLHWAALLLWVAVAAALLGLHVFGFSTRVELLRFVVPFRPRYGQLTVQHAQTLVEFGLTPQLYYAGVLTSELAMAGGAFAVAALAFARRRNDWPVLLFSLMLVSFVCTNTNFTRALSDIFPWVFILRRWLQALGFAILLPVFCTFPDGRFTPGWTRWLCTVWVAQVALWLGNLAPFNPLPGSSVGNPAIVGGLYLFSWIGVGLAALIGRLRHAAPGRGRQQLLWAISAIAAATGVAFASYMAEGLISLLRLAQTPRDQLLIALTIRPLYYFATALIIPIFLGPALLRYGLWGLRPLLTRTAIFAIATVGLTAIYLALAGIVGWLIGRSSVAATLTAALTAALAALVFAPLRRALQRAVDQRLYRDRTDLRARFDALGDALRTSFDRAQIALTLAEQTAAALPSEYAEVLLRNAAGALVSAATAGAGVNHKLTPEALAVLDRGEAVAAAAPLALLVPIRAVSGGSRALVGVLALGPHRSERPYDRDQIRSLVRLGADAGDALTIAQAVQDARALEAYRASPAGQAEALAVRLISNQATALGLLRRLAGDEAQRPIALLIPTALRSLAASDLARVAELFVRLSEPALAGPALAALPPALAPLGPSAIATTYEALARAHRGDDVAALSAWRAPAPFEPALDALCAQLAAAARALASALPPADGPAQLAGLARAQACIRPIPVPAPDTLIAALIAERWLDVTGAARRAVLGSAQLSLSLVTRRLVAAPTITLTLELANSGVAAATDVSVRLGPSNALAPLPDATGPLTLAPGAKARLSLTATVLSADASLPLALHVSYTDPGGAQHTVHSDASVTLLHASTYAHELGNPFVPGTPLDPTSPVFVGRADDIAWLRAHAASPQALPLLITGQRRMGKTTLLLRMQRELADTHLVVFADGQALAIDPAPGSLFVDLAALLHDAASLPPVNEAAAASASGFLRVVLPGVVAAAAPRRVLLLLDEFEELEQRLHAERFGVEVFGLLRHIAQHVQGVQTVLVGGNRPASLANPVWTGLLNVALHRRVSALDDGAARRLIGQAPLVLDDGAREAVLALAGGHPYVLQLCCHTLVNQANHARRTYVLPEHIEAMVDTVLEHGEAHFASLWAEADDAERRVLLALATTTGAPAISEAHDSATVERLVGRELVERIGSPADGSTQWRLRLLGRWIRRNR